MRNDCDRGRGDIYMTVFHSLLSPPAGRLIQMQEYINKNYIATNLSLFARHGKKAELVSLAWLLACSEIIWTIFLTALYRYASADAQREFYCTTFISSSFATFNTARLNLLFFFFSFFSRIIIIKLPCHETFYHDYLLLFPNFFSIVLQVTRSLVPPVDHWLQVVAKTVQKTNEEQKLDYKSVFAMLIRRCITDINRANGCVKDSNIWHSSNTWDFFAYRAYNFPEKSEYTVLDINCQLLFSWW